MHTRVARPPAERTGARVVARGQQSRMPAEPGTPSVLCDTAEPAEPALRVMDALAAVGPGWPVSTAAVPCAEPG